MNACTITQLSGHSRINNLRFSIKPGLMIAFTWPLLIVLLLGCDDSGHSATEVSTTAQDTETKPAEELPHTAVDDESQAREDGGSIYDHPTLDVLKDVGTSSVHLQSSELTVELASLTESIAENTKDRGTMTLAFPRSTSFRGKGDHPSITWYYLKHNGPEWDDGLTDSRLSANAFTNFLQQLSGLPLNKTNLIAAQPRALTINQLAWFPSGDYPPFIFLTGHGEIPLSNIDKRLLRQYIVSVGTVFADAASPSFDRAFRTLMAELFPDNPLTVIPKDDHIFRRPYRLPYGVDPMAAHGGTEVMAIRIDNRYAVCYHPGDIKAAFKDDAHLMPENMRQRAFQFLYNFIHHSINRSQVMRTRARRQ